MGHTPSIEELRQKEDAFRGYLKELQDKLEQRATEYDDKMNKEIDNFYNTNKWQRSAFIYGKTADFMQKHEWSLANIKEIIDKLSEFVFGGGKPSDKTPNPPGGATVTPPGDVGIGIAALKDWQLYVAGQAFNLISGIIDSFGSSSQLTFNSSSQHTSLGNGMHLFATVVGDSYRSTQFFSNEEIYEYLVIYRIFYSVGEAKQQANIQLTRLYEDSITGFVAKCEDQLKKLMDDKISPEQYQSNTIIYNNLISDYRKKLADLETNNNLNQIASNINRYRQRALR